MCIPLPVIGTAFDRVGLVRVGRVDLLEAVLHREITGVEIRMILPREGPTGSGNDHRLSMTVNAESPIVVLQ